MQPSPDTPRSLIREPSPPATYLFGSSVYIEFANGTSAVSVSIMCEETGECIYMENHQSPQTIVIPLNGEESGWYRLEVVINGKTYEGEFQLE